MAFLKNILVIFTLLLSYTRADTVIPRSSNFSDVVKSPAFIDKTLLLKKIIEYEQTMVTVPMGFMKSTNLDMIKSFLSIKLNKHGKPKKLEKTKYFKIFKNLNIYKKEKDFFHKHFGKYPVLYLNLTDVLEPIANFWDAVDVLRDRIHNAYLEHVYLINSSVLNDKEMTIVRSWNDEDKYTEIIQVEVKRGLKDLVWFLYKHFNKRKVFVLVDEYDNLIKEGLFFDASNMELTHIIELTFTQISRLLKWGIHVAGGLISGVSNIVGANFSTLQNIKILKFLRRHDLVDFYGFTENEAEDLFKNPIFNLTTDKIIKARSLYNGYSSEAGKTIYCPKSVLGFLKRGREKMSFNHTGYVDSLEILFEHDSVKSVLTDLLNNNSVPITEVSQLNTQDTLDLRHMFVKPIQSLLPTINLLLTHLLELGFLSYDVHNDTNKHYLRIPNDEVWDYIFRKMKSYYFDVYKVEDEYFSNINRYNFRKWFDIFSSFVKDKSQIRESIFKAYKVFNSTNVTS